MVVETIFDKRESCESVEQDATTGQTTNDPPRAPTRGAEVKSRMSRKSHPPDLKSLLCHPVVVIGCITLVGLLLAIAFGVLGHSAIKQETKEKTYYLVNLVKDTCEISLAVGALFAGLLAIYRRWYNRYEPLVFFVACGLIRISVVRALCHSNRRFKDLWGKDRPCPEPHSDEELQRLHDLPIVILHESTMRLLGVHEGDTVDLLFTTPEAKAIWAIAFAYSYESASNGSEYSDWPIGLSMSLRRYFQMERPCDGRCHSGKSPEGWSVVQANTTDLADLHASRRKDNALIWMAPTAYSVRFREKGDPLGFHPNDDMKNDSRILEYVGISLRVFKRNLFRYRAAYE